MYATLRKILGGQESVKLFLEFLKRNNKTDMLILKHTKVCGRSSSRGFSYEPVPFQRNPWSPDPRYTTMP